MIYISPKYNTRCKGRVCHQTTNLFTIDIIEIEIDNQWISFEKFAEILKTAFPFNEISTYDIVEKNKVES